MATQDTPAIDPSQRVIFSAPELLVIRQSLQELVPQRESADAEVWFDGGLVDDRIQAQLRLSNMARTRVLTMEAAVPVDIKNAEEIVEMRAGVVEFIGAMFEEWLEEEGLRSPSLDWKEHEYAGKIYVFRGSLLNEDAENQADAFLREHGLDPEHLWDDEDEDVDADN